MAAQEDIESEHRALHDWPVSQEHAHARAEHV
jgi:hypothetical protein